MLPLLFSWQSLAHRDRICSGSVQLKKMKLHHLVMKECLLFVHCSLDIFWFYSIPTIKEQRGRMDVEMDPRKGCLCHSWYPHSALVNHACAHTCTHADILEQEALSTSPTCSGFPILTPPCSLRGEESTSPRLQSSPLPLSGSLPHNFGIYLKEKSEQ